MKDLVSLKDNTRIKPAQILKMKCTGYTNEQLSIFFNIDTNQVQKFIDSALFNLSRFDGNSYSNIINLLKKTSKHDKLYAMCSITIYINDIQEEEYKCKEGMVSINIQKQIDIWENMFGRSEVVIESIDNKDYYNITFKASPGIRAKIIVIH